MTEERVWLIHCKCPNGHFIMGCAFVCEYDPAWSAIDDTNNLPEPACGKIKEAMAMLFEMVDASIEKGRLNPWCDTCKAPRSTWPFTPLTTRYKSIREAAPFLAADAIKEMLTQATTRLADAQALVDDAPGSPAAHSHANGIGSGNSESHPA